MPHKLKYMRDEFYFCKQQNYPEVLKQIRPEVLEAFSHQCSVYIGHHTAKSTESPDSPSISGHFWDDNTYAEARDIPRLFWKPPKKAEHVFKHRGSVQYRKYFLILEKLGKMRPELVEATVKDYGNTKYSSLEWTDDLIWDEIASLVTEGHRELWFVPQAYVQYFTLNKFTQTRHSQETPYPA